MTLMKTLLPTAAALCLLTQLAPGQGAQADQIKRRAKEQVNQSNVRQGVAPPSQPQPPPPAAAQSPGAKPTTTPQQSVTKLQADIAAIKSGSPATAEQKQQFIKDIAAACRGTKPSLPSVTAFVNELTSALGDKPLDSTQQSRLAQNIEGVLNSGAMPSSQFDAVITDVQAILQVSGAKRNLAISTANKLKTVGLEVRRGVR